MGQLVFQATLGGAVNLIGPNIASTVNFTLPSADGSSGQTWTTNGSGVLSFGTLGVAGGGTGVTTSTGTGSVVLSNSPTLVTPALGTPSSATLTNATGLPISTGVSGLGTGVATALAVNVGSAGAPVVNGGALGTPSSGTVTNLTGTASININGTVGATTPTTGAFTTTTVSTSETLSYGTANGVTYLNGSKVLTSGSALTFDGTTFKVAKAGGVFGPTNLVYVDVTSSYGGVTLNSASGQNCFFELYQGGTTKVGEFGIDAANSLVNIGGFGSYNTRFYASGSEGMRLTSTSLYTASGINVGIGTSSPAAPLSFASSTGQKIRLYNGLSGYGIGVESSEFRFVTDFSASFTWGTGSYASPTVQMRLDSSGNLGLGVTPSASWSGTYAKAMQLGNKGAAVSGFTSSLSSLPYANISNNSYYASDANWKYYTANGAALYQQAEKEHRWLISSGSAVLDGTISFTQALTLDASGNLLVGTTSSNSGRMDVEAQTGGVAISFRRNTGVYGSGTVVGTIACDGSSTTYNTSSDYRLKNTVAPMTGALAKVAQLKPVTYKWNADGSDGEGFIAHELAEVCPHAVTGEKDAVDEEGNPKYQGIDTSFLVATLTAALQEAVAKITALEARLDAANL